MQIRDYTQQVTPQGEIRTERQPARADSFGGDIGQAEENLGNSMYQSADIMTQLADAKDTVWRNNAVSAYNLQQFQNLQSAKTDPDFAKKYGADGGQFASSFQEQLTQASANLVGAAPSIRSQQQLQMSLNQANQNLMGHAMDFQAQTGGAYMKDQLTQSMQNDAKLVEQSPGDTSMVLDRGKLAIAQAPLLTPEAKTELLKSYEQNISLAAGKGLVLHSPEKVLAAIAPDVLAGFKPTPRVLANTAVPVTSFQPATNVAPAVQAVQPLVTASASKFNVDPNFLAAQLHVESKGNPTAVNNADANVTGSASVGIAQFQPETAKQYGITDATDPKQAIPGMAHYMSDLLTQFGGDYRKAAVAYNWGPGHLAQDIAANGADWYSHIPDSTKNYIDQIFSHAPPITPADQNLSTQIQDVQNPPAASRASSNPDWFNNLNWEQQFQIVREAEQGVRANQVRDAQTIQLQEQQHKQQQQKIMNDMFDRIGAQTNPLTIAEVRGNSDLDYQGKEHMIEAISKGLSGEMKTDPAVFTDLLHRIHADPATPNAITNPDELVPFVGNGLKFDDYKALRSELEGKGQPQADMRKQFFESAKKQISGSNMVANDPQGEKDYYNWYVAVNQLIDQKTKEGKPLMELLNPSSKEYLGNTIDAYVRSPQQQAQDMAKRMRDAQKSQVATPTGTPSPTVRQAGESLDDYRKRIMK